MLGLGRRLGARLARYRAPLSRLHSAEVSMGSYRAQGRHERAQVGAARVLDGKRVAAEWLEAIAADVAALPVSCPRPSLAVVHVAHRADSALYVERKREACARVGIDDWSVDLPPAISQAELLRTVRELAADKRVHGLLVQLPLPAHLDEAEILNAIPTCKDVDAFNPVNAGRLAMRGREPAFLPCCPKGMLELLDRSGISVVGKHACVIGSSNTVGNPLSSMLLKRGAAAVTVCDTRQALSEEHRAQLTQISRSADLVVAAVGRAGLVTRSWVRPGAVVLDVGINTEGLVPGEHSADGRPFRVVGDVLHGEVSQVASALTPVPGGVGPMTIAALMQNTLLAAEHARRKQPGGKASKAASQDSHGAGGDGKKFTDPAA